MWCLKVIKTEKIHFFHETTQIMSHKEIHFANQITNSGMCD